LLHKIILLFAKAMKRLFTSLVTTLIAFMTLMAQNHVGEAVMISDTLDVGILKADSDTLPYPQNIRQRLDTILTARMLQRSQIGLMVYDLTADSCIYAYNHQQTMRPASTQKLVTAIAAIDQLGGNYQFRTSLYYTGSIRDGVLTGNLICVGGMDPEFSRDDLMAFVESLRRLGVDTIRGSILADRSFKDDNLLGEGWCWDDDNPTLSPLLISQKDDFTGRLAQALKENGAVLITDDMNLQPQSANTQSPKTLVCTRTHTIDQILAKMMKDSDNLYAEAMFYQLGASTGNRTSKATHARNVINQLISKVGLQPANYKIADGSGLSLYNYLTPELHITLLRYAYRNPNVLAHLLPALPIAAEDGTLKNRMAGTSAASNVRAKTGTVTAVSCLAGYCTADNGHDLCFAIMNQGVLKIADGRTMQDRICQALCAPATHTLRQAITPMTPPQKVTKTKKPRKPQRAQKNPKRRKRRK